MLRNISKSLIGYLVPIFVAVPAIPYLMNSIGDVNFGILAISWTIIFIARACDFGVSAAITKYTARFPKVRSIRRVGFRLIIELSAWLQIIFLIGAGVAYLLISKEQHSVWLATTISGFAIIPMAFINASRAVLEATREFGKLSLLRVLYMPANFLIPVAIIWCHPEASVNLLVLGVLASKVVEAVHYSVWSLDIFVIKGGGSEKKKSLLLGFGKWIGVNSVLGPIFSYSDRFIVSSVVSVGALGALVPATELINRLMVLPMAVTGVLFPEFSRSKDRLFEKYAVSFETFYFINTVIAVLLISVSYPLIELWLGSGKDSVAMLMVLFLASWPLASQNRIVSTYLQVRGGQKAVTLSATVIAVIYLSILVVLISFFGVVGAPLAALVRVVLVCVVYFKILKRVGESFSRLKIVSGFILLLLYSIAVLFDFSFVYLAALVVLYCGYNYSAIGYIVMYRRKLLKKRFG